MGFEHQKSTAARLGPGDFQKKLVEMNDGEIGVESAPGAGSNLCFKVWFQKNEQANRKSHEGRPRACMDLTRVKFADATRNQR